MLYRLEDEGFFVFVGQRGAKKFWTRADSMQNFPCSWLFNISCSETIEEDGSKPASLSGRKPDRGFGPPKCDGFVNQNLGVGDSLVTSHPTEGLCDATKHTNEDCRMI